ncbi:hypothetical protein BDV36DRAFT_249925 [Aspergillus pseudocaelatus]|uniref:Uncharacterized protein n=1 Tax=Aspergillus pseudocaelatus TaxID=1825620 RepID=A0ABQ6WVH4_9EURO|nr:hypothetical protein BDV36DRAFT_249925 [Aspergillus pseudocaelatus]
MRKLYSSDTMPVKGCTAPLLHLFRFSLTGLGKTMEAHLTPSFSSLMASMAGEQLSSSRCSHPWLASGHNICSRCQECPRYHLSSSKEDAPMVPPSIVSGRRSVFLMGQCLRDFQRTGYLVEEAMSWMAFTPTWSTSSTSAALKLTFPHPQLFPPDTAHRKA